MINLLIDLMEVGNAIRDISRQCRRSIKIKCNQATRQGRAGERKRLEGGPLREKETGVKEREMKVLSGGWLIAPRDWVNTCWIKSC